MARKISLVSPLLLSLASCTHYGVKQDIAVAPIEAGQSRIETILCDHYSVGDNICWIEDGYLEDDHNLTIKTYFSGELTLVSPACGINKKIKYKDFEDVSFKLGELISGMTHTSACLIDIVMNYKFPNQKKSNVTVRGMSGRVIVASYDQDLIELASVGSHRNMVYEDDATYYPGAIILSLFRHQIMDLSFTPVLHLGGSQKGMFRIDGCGIEPLTAEYDEPEGALDVVLIDALLQIPEGMSCPLYLRVVREDMDKDLVVMISVEMLSIKLTPMALPRLRYEEGALHVETNEPVSWTILNEKAYNFGSGEMKLEDKSFILKQITAKGRSLILKAEGREVIWSK